MQLLKKLMVSILLVGLLFMTGTTVFAADSNLKASVRSSDPLKPVLILANTGSEPCQVVQSNLGTVSITKVTQDGREISPLALTVAFDEGLEVELAKKLQTLQPGKRTEIPLQILPYKDGHAILAITWSKEAGAIAMMYPIQSNKSYSLEVTYASPITASGAPMCGMAVGTNEFDFDIPAFLITATGFVIIFFLLMGIIWLLRSKKRKNVAKTVVVMVMVITSLLGLPRQAQADYSVPESAVGQFDECMAVFERYPDITGPVLDALDDGRIIIHANHSAENYATDWPDGSYHIHWDAFNTYNYYSDDGSEIVSTPCDRLFHEMYHVYEMMNDTFSREFCGGTGIETKEVMATRAQNRLREALGLLPRTHYGTERLPEGACTPPPPEPPACTGTSCGESTGEPHLKTFDHLRYDFQAVGEFILARDPQGDFEVQTRQEPWSTARDVSMNTAVAMRVGTDRVEVQIAKQKMVLLLNGKPQLRENMALTGGGAIASRITTGWKESSTVKVSWPDGSAVVANRIGTFGLDITVDPAKSRAGKLEGLLGNYNEDSTDELKINGSGSIITPDFEKLYPAYADSWRVDETTSLFTYEEGKDTNSYTDRTFPDNFVVAKDLPNRAAAEALCKSLGVSDVALLENCIFDVALTGRPEFARSASVRQNASRTTDYGGQMEILKVTKPGETASVAFEGKENETVFLDISNATFPYQCGSLGIRDPEGKPIATGCIIEGEGFVDTVQLPVSGEYSIYIDPANQNIGQATVQLIKTVDFKSNITPGGKSITAKLATPGSIAELSFSGTAGQKVFIDFLGGTIPDQCGGIALQTPSGSSVGSVCLSNATGILDPEGTLLPTTGIYTLRINPTEKNIGDITVQIRR